MCGIVGIVDPGRKHPSAARTVRAMTEALVHRGPDSDGYHDANGVHFGMRRLAVIDREHGDQPIHDESHRIAVVFNGEIYNFRELREELIAAGHTFATAGDTEVIAHLYEESGLDAFGRLNGMFAIALHDTIRNRVVLARDPHGIKPLFWSDAGDGLRFASELKALFVDRHLRRQPDLDSILDYLVHWYVPTPRSAFAGVRKLRPGHLLLLDGNRAPEERAYRPRPKDPGTGPTTPREAARTTQAAVEDAVRRHLVADVPVGVFLSGGLDSAIIGSLAARLAPERLRAFTVSFGRHGSYDEAPVARTIARHAGLDHVVIPFPEDPTELAADALATFDEPFGDYSSIGMTLLCREAKRFATVCLAGDGGDEVFAGYPHYLAPRYAAAFRRLPRGLRSLIASGVRRLPVSFERLSFDYMARRFVRGAEFSDLDAHLLYKAIFFGEERQRLLGPKLRETGERGPLEAMSSALEEARARPDPLGRLLTLDQRTFLLDDGLVKVDRTSMRASLEVRLPLLDHVVVDAAAAIPRRLHLRRGRTKAVLRDVGRSVLPKEASGLRKRGFTPPMPHWLGGSLRRLAERHLARDRVKRAGLVREEAVLEILGEHRSRTRDRCREIWTLVALHEWWHRQGF